MVKTQKREINFNNPEERAKYMIEWKLKNKDNVKNKAYKIIKCDICDSEYKKCNKVHHLKTKKHLNKLVINNENKVIDKIHKEYPETKLENIINEIKLENNENEIKLENNENEIKLKIYHETNDFIFYRDLKGNISQIDKLI
jgi:uncharacterized protein with gpF-like domain